MSNLAVAFLVIDTLALLLLPRRWAAVPLLACACYLPLDVGFELGQFNFYALRFLIAVAAVRLLLRGERIEGPVKRLDSLMLLWGASALISSLLYADATATFVNRLGLVYTGLGTYFALRTFCPCNDDVVRLCGATAVLLVPVAAAMLYEGLAGRNALCEFSGIAIAPELRNGMVRAQGAFAHSILAGSVGAAGLPLMATLWRSHRGTALVGGIACLTMVFTSGSSGPIVSASLAVAALLMWSMRRHMRLVRWSALFGYLALDAVMQAPAYYLLTRVDLTGSSTSWHRAALIDSAIEHWSEWWLAGTAVTRHWMPYGVPWSASHSDITNQYLRMGVDGGLPLMILFIAVLAKGFSMVGHAVQEASVLPSRRPFVNWALGASLFAHAASFFSVSYFDQSVVFFYLTLAAIGSGSIAIVASPVKRASASSYAT